MCVHVVSSTKKLSTTLSYPKFNREIIIIRLAALIGSNFNSKLKMFKLQKRNGRNIFLCASQEDPPHNQLKNFLGFLPLQSKRGETQLFFF